MEWNDAPGLGLFLGAAHLGQSVFILSGLGLHAVHVQAHVSATACVGRCWSSLLSDIFGFGMCLLQCPPGIAWHGMHPSFAPSPGDCHQRVHRNSID